MAQQLNDVRGSISEMLLVFDMLLDFIFAFCFMVTRWLLQLWTWHPCSRQEEEGRGKRQRLL